MTQPRTSVHDHPRKEALAAMRRMLDFLEITPEVDLPESMGDLLIRTLARQNRGELKEKPAVAKWFRQQVTALEGETYNDGDHFGAVRDFGAGVRIVLSVGVSEVCHKTTETKTVQRTEEQIVSTWHCPPELVALGYQLNQNYLRERERTYAKMLGGLDVQYLV